MNRASYAVHEWSATMDVVLERCDAPYTPKMYMQAFDDYTGGPLIASLRPQGELPDPSSQVDVAIIGGGVHGLGIAIRLRHALPGAKIIIIDDQDLLLGQFVRRCNNSYTRILRSPIHHHLAPDGSIQLLDFLRLHYSQLTKFERLMTDLAQGSNRTLTPGQMFVLHTEHLLRRYDLPKRVVNDRVVGFSEQSGDYKTLVLSSGKVVKARIVVESTGGMPEGIPESLIALYPSTVAVYSGYDDKPKRVGNAIHVHGAGMCAAHHVLEFAKHGCKVTWISNYPVQFSCTDFPQVFTRIEGIDKWAAQEQAERHIPRPTILPEFFPLLQPFFASGSVSLVGFVDKFAAQNIDAVVFCGGLICPNLDGPSDVVTLKSGLAGIDRFGPAAPNIDGVRLAARMIVPEVANAIERQQVARKRSTVRGTAPISFAARCENA